MAGVKRLFKPGTLAYFCDQCGSGVFGDDGYLTVISSRWRCYHDACKSVGNSVGGTPNALAGKREIIIRISRVSTYPLLLTTIASLADSIIGFERTNWPTLLCRVVADTNWRLSHPPRRSGKKRGLEPERTGSDQ